MWMDCTAKFVLQLELLHDRKGAAGNEHYFRHIAAHLGMDGHVRGGVSRAKNPSGPLSIPISWANAKRQIPVIQAAAALMME